MALDRDRVLELLETLKSSSAAEISVTEGDTTIRLARFVPPPASLLVAANGELIALPCATEALVETITVTARVVGLFYRGRQPGEDAVVSIGDTVKQAQTLGIIEVLRKPTEITSPAGGVITAILCEDGSGVQYGDPLFVIQV